MTKRKLLGAAVRGAGNDAVVFLNGFGTEQSVWAHQVDHFSAHRRTITLDHVGSGASCVAAYRADRYSSLYDYADDIIGLIEELDLPRVDIVGHSVGAMIGLITAVALPNRVRRLAMISASPRYIDADGYRGGFTASAIEHLLAEANADYQAWAAGFSPVVAANPEVPAVARDFARFLLRLRPDIAQSSLRVAFSSDMRALLPRASLPTLVVQSSEDIAVPVEVGRYLARSLPQAILVELAYSGHLPHMLAPDAVTALLAPFLDGRPQDAAV